MSFKSRPSRRRFAFSAISACTTVGAFVRSADAAEFEWKLGNDQPADHPVTVRAVLAARNVQLQSGGRISIQVFPNNQLGASTAMLAQVRSGAVQMMLVSNSILGAVAPIAAIPNAPFAFTSYKQAFSVTDGQLGSLIRDGVAKAGLYSFEKAAWPAGFQQITTGLKPINRPQDLKGMKMRVPPAPIYVSAFRALEASPTPVEFADTYVALQTHLVDGGLFGTLTTEILKLYEVQKYLAIVNLVFAGYTGIVGNAAWQSLPKNLQDILERNFSAQAVESRKDFVNLESSTEDKLRRRGMTITHPDLAPFQAAIRGSGQYEQLRDQFGSAAWNVLEKAIGRNL